MQLKLASVTSAAKTKRGRLFLSLDGGFTEKLTCGWVGGVGVGGWGGWAEVASWVKEAEPLNLDSVERSVAVIVAVPGVVEEVIVAV